MSVVGSYQSQGKVTSIQRFFKNLVNKSSKFYRNPWDGEFCIKVKDFSLDSCWLSKFTLLTNRKLLG